MKISVFRGAIIIWKTNKDHPAKNHRRQLEHGWNVLRGRGGGGNNHIYSHFQHSHQWWALSKFPATSWTWANRPRARGMAPKPGHQLLLPSLLPLPSAFTDLFQIRGHGAGGRSWFCCLYNKDFQRPRNGQTAYASFWVSSLLNIFRKHINKPKNLQMYTKPPCGSIF